MNTRRAFVESAGKRRMIGRRETVRCGGAQQVQKSEGAETNFLQLDS